MTLPAEKSAPVPPRVANAVSSVIEGIGIALDTLALDEVVVRPTGAVSSVPAFVVRAGATLPVDQVLLRLSADAL